MVLTNFLSGSKGTFGGILINDFDFWAGKRTMFGLDKDVRTKSESGFKFFTDFSTAVVLLFVRHFVCDLKRTILCI